MNENGVPQRLLTLQEAAAYCGVATRNFKKHMPVTPIRLGPNELWDIRAIDAFIDGLQGMKSLPPVDWTGALKRL